MLGHFQYHCDYLNLLKTSLANKDFAHVTTDEYYSGILKKIKRLNLDCLLDIISDLYSYTGRPSNFQIQIFRSFILMSHFHENDIDKWVIRLKSDKVFRLLSGFSSHDSIPGASTFRDLYNRLWKGKPPNKILPPRKKPDKKEGYGSKKMPPKNPGIIKKLADLFESGFHFQELPERIFQQILLYASVIPSFKLGLIGDGNNKIDCSSDGTCVVSNSNAYGHKICDCKTVCTCNRSYADPIADFGWDSYHRRWFFGYSMYMFATKNSSGFELPLYIQYEPASAYDGTTFVPALYHFKKLFEDHFSINSMILDSAHDNAPTYNLLNNLGIYPIIDLNKRSPDITQENVAAMTDEEILKTSIGIKDPDIWISKDGSFRCKGNYHMVFFGFNRSKKTIKYRCPMKFNKAIHCEYCDECNKSSYGKSINVKVEKNPRYFTAIPRNSERFKLLYNKRTASERLNNRILTDYRLEQPKRYGMKKFAFFSLLAAMNIHLDTQIKYCSES